MATATQLNEVPEVEIIKDINRTSYAQIWKWIPINNNMHPGLVHKINRLNALGDSFYFIKGVLRKKRLSNVFHRQQCDTYQCWSLKEVNEIPRDHFKTTLGLGHAMWWALPFTDVEEKLMRALGYDDAFIKWMYRAHDQNTRTLICMEVIKNAWKVGRKISNEYKGNDFFKKLFPEIQPDSSCQWSADTMTHKRSYKGNTDPNQGEGTYEFTGVDAALQSKHYKRCIYDDLYGREALKSELVATSTWEWMQLAVGAFDSDPDDPDMECDEIVNGNRWSFHDLNDTIRQKLTYFHFHTHDAEGGCCDLHPAGKPIFPEEWTLSKLARFRERLGEYYYSCQFRNKPIPPGGNLFKTEWLKYYAYKTVNVETVQPGFKSIDLNLGEDSLFLTQTYKIIPKEELQTKRHMSIRHEIKDGVQRKDILTSHLSKMLMLDPNHNGEEGRCNHALMLLGINHDPFSIYILDGYAKTCSREDIIHYAYVMAEKWRIREIWVETSAGQTWCKTSFDTEDKYRKQLGKWHFHKVNPFKDNRNENAKSDRIEDTEPFFRRGQIWICTNNQDGFTQQFLKEYNEYPLCATKDIMDILGHGIQNLQHSTMSEREVRMFADKQKEKYQRQLASRNSITGY